MLERQLQHEQQWRRESSDSNSEAPNIGRDRLLTRLREVHGHARYDIAIELTRSFSVPKFMQAFDYSKR